MKNNFVKLLKIIVPLLLGGLLLWWYFGYVITANERLEIWKNVRQANYFWVIASLLCGLLSHFIRALRWNYLLQPLGYRPALANNFMLVLIAYLANLFVPRSGEVLRATGLATYEKVPFEKGFGTIVSERIIDLFMLFVVIMVSFFWQSQKLAGFLKTKGFEISYLLAAGVIIFLGAWASIYFVKRSNWGIAQKIKTRLTGLLEGITSVLKMKKKGVFIIYTLLIWFLYIFMFVLIKFALPDTVFLSFGALLTGFVAGAFAMTTTNGGFGLFPIAVGEVLMLYGATEAAGLAFGWIMWSTQTAMILVFGLLSFIILPFFNREV